MANPASNTGLGGVGGVRAAGLPSTRSSFAFATNGTSSGSISNLTAVRRSVAKTSKANPANFSTVFSETQGLRSAYSGVELDTPAITRSGTS